MEDQRFDALTRLLTATGSRRRVLGALAAGLGGGLLRHRATSGAAAPPAGPQCSPAAAPLPSVSVTPRDKNNVGGSCADFNDHAISRGVAGADGSRIPGQGGATEPSFKIATTAQIPVNPTKPGQFCAKATLSFPSNVSITMASQVSVLNWRPTPAAIGACLAEWQAWLARTIAHEARHVADNAAVLQAAQARWKTPRTYQKCAASDKEAEDAVNALIDKDLADEQAKMATHAQACSDAFHRSPAGQPDHGLDCSKCCKDNKPTCGGKCCQNNLVCSTYAGGGVRAFALQGTEDCVCPDGQPPCGDACCGPDETCSGGACAPIKCGPCRIAHDGACYDLDCGPGKTCVNDACVPAPSPAPSSAPGKFFGVQCLPDYLVCPNYCCPPGDYYCGDGECCFDPTLPCLPGIPPLP